MTERASFGLELRRVRERRGLSLDQLAEATKISGSLFAGLERGDLSRWPSGIFRRAFVRSYAQAVGIDPEETVTRFVRLFPETDGDAAEEAVREASAEDAAAPGEAPRLALDDSVAAVPAGRRGARRVAAAAVDLLIAAVPGAIAGMLLGWEHFWLVAAAIGAAGHLIVVSIAGASPGSLLFLRPRAVPVSALQAPEQPRRRVEVEAQPASRRRVSRHGGGPRPVSTRARRIQH